MATDVAIQGSEEERRLFTDAMYHYTMARQDLDQRRKDFDKKDILFRSHIVKEDWPYRSVVFDPIVFTAIYEKTARTFANKPRGRMTPREGGDALGAKINNELLAFQWDDNERVDAMAMLTKWALMDLNTRKYGASFGLVPWQWQRQVQRTDDKSGKSKLFYDGPSFKPWANRDVLHNPSYSVIKNWIQLRSYPTYQELANVNDVARSKPVYINLDILKQSINKETKTGGDSRANNYIPKNLSIKGLTDYLGRDPSYKTIEVVTEYRDERWITFAPKHGLILRNIPNPYKHCQIPVVLLKYYPIDDDIYGLSEIEPVERLQKALNAYVNQNLDTLNLNTYVPLKVRNTQGAVQMHTLEFGPGKKWLMNDPLSDVVAHNQGTAGVAEFVNVYRLMKSAIYEALGEATAGASSQAPGQPNKTATEIKDTAFSRSSRDNFNQLFLAEAMQKQMMFWFKMNQQFLFNSTEKQKIIEITGKDAIRFFQDMGLDGNGLTDQHIEALSNPDLANTVQPSDLMSPIYPVTTQEGTVPKLEMEEGGQSGKLIIEPEDLSGEYNYIPDIGSMSSTASERETKAKAEVIASIQQPTTLQLLAQEGKRPKMADLLITYAEDIGFKNADQYFENIPQPQMQGGVNNGNQVDQTGQPVQGGGGSAQGLPNGQANVPNQGMAGGNGAVLAG